MEKKRSFFETIPGVALVTAVILMVPLIAMQFSAEVDWSFGDFVIMGLLLFGTGMSYIFIIRQAPHFIYKAAVALALGSTLFMIWANLAVGLIGSGPHAGNLMYIGVVAVVIIGILRSRFSSRGMELAMYVTAFSLVLLALIALLANMQQYPGSSVTEILMINGFFATLFLISAVLFRYAVQEESGVENSKR